MKIEPKIKEELVQLNIRIKKSKHKELKKLCKELNYSITEMLTYLIDKALKND